MTSYLLAVRDVDAAAAGCDYLVDRLGPGDSVVVLAVVGDENAVSGDTARDVADALNVAGVRLPGAETERGEGEPAEAILAAARDHDVDEILLVASGEDGGSTISAVRADADRPVSVVSSD